MSFAARLTRAPIACDAAAGAEAAAAFSDLAPELRDLLAGTAGCSPFLKGLMQREAEWLRPALAIEPETALASVLAALDEVGLEALGSALRQAKRRVALLVALADLGGVWGLEAVTGGLTRLADRAVDLSLKRLVAEEIRRGKLPGATPDDAQTAGGMVALAMGKIYEASGASASGRSRASGSCSCRRTPGGRAAPSAGASAPASPAASSWGRHTRAAGLPISRRT